MITLHLAYWDRFYGITVQSPRRHNIQVCLSIPGSLRSPFDISITLPNCLIQSLVKQTHWRPWYPGNRPCFRLRFHFITVCIHWAFHHRTDASIVQTPLGAHLFFVLRACSSLIFPFIITPILSLRRVRPKTSRHFFLPAEHDLGGLWNPQH